MSSADTVCRLIREFCPGPTITGAEIGVSQGKTSRAMLISFPTLFLYMVDAWAVYPETDQYRQSGDGHARLTLQQQNQHKETAVRNTSFAGDRRSILPMDSLSAAKTFVESELDFVMIDGDHTRVLDDIEAWVPIVRAGGLVCGHDIDHPRDKRGLWNVRKSVEEYSRRLLIPFDVDGDVWWFKRPARG